MTSALKKINEGSTNAHQSTKINFFDEHRETLDESNFKIERRSLKIMLI